MANITVPIQVNLPDDWIEQIVNRLRNDPEFAQSEYRTDEWCTDCKEYDSERHCCPRFNRVIRTAMTERKKGRWIIHDDGYVRCSVCNTKAPWITDGVAWMSDYCPNCGARMEEQE